jgi:hypothetical protein
MPRRAAMVTQAQITRAVKAVQAAGLVVAKVEIDANGKVVVTSREAAPIAPADEFEAWEAQRADHAQGH